MNWLQIYDGTFKAIINTNRYVSTCVCCCETLPATLYLHVIPTYSLTGGGGYISDCEEQDKGTGDVIIGGDSWQVAGFQGSNCIEYEVPTVTATPALECDDPTGPPPIAWELAAHLYCRPVNVFEMSLCFGLNDSADEDFPNTDPLGQNCEEVLLGIEPLVQNTCEAQPGEFWVESPPIIPGATLPLGAAACQCAFIFIWNEDPVFIPEKRPYFLYMGGGSASLPSNVGGNLRSADKLIGVGTLPAGLDEYF